MGAVQRLCFRAEAPRSDMGLLDVSQVSWYALGHSAQLIIRYHDSAIRLAEMLTIPSCRELYLYFDLLISIIFLCARNCCIPER